MEINQQFNSDNVDDAILSEFDGKNAAHVVHESATEVEEKRSRLQQIWEVCLNFLAGNQWIRWNPKSRIIDRLSDIRDTKRGDIIRIVANKMLPAFDHKLGRLSSVWHLPECIPAPDRADMFEAAQIRTQYLQAWADARNVKSLDRELKSWCVACGPAWVKVWWDFEKGTNMPDIEVLSPFAVMPWPWGVSDPKRAQAVIETRAVPIDQLRDLYPVEMDGIKQGELEEENNMILAATDSFIQGESNTREIKHMLRVREVRRGKSAKHPNGYKLIVTRNRVLEAKPLQDADLFPEYFRFAYRRFPGAMYSPGLIEPNISMQIARNKLFSDMLGAIWGEGPGRRLMIPESLNVGPEDFDNIGSPVTYEDDENKPDNVPWYLVTPPMSVDMFRASERVDLTMDDGLQLHPVSRGMSPGSIESGAGLEALQVKDDVLLGPLIEDFNETWARVYNRVGVLTSRHQNGPINLIGIDAATAQPFAVQDFLADKDEQSWRIRTRCINRGPTDKMLTMQYNEKLLQYGAMQDLPPREIRKNFQLGVEASLFEPEARDRVHAREESAAIMRGEMRGVEPWHNHQVHLEEHRIPKMHSRWLTLNPAIKQQYADHERAHEEAIVMAIEGQLAAQQQLPVGQPQGV